VLLYDLSKLLKENSQALNLRLAPADFSIGAVEINVNHHMSSDERAEFDQLGVNVDQLPPVPVVYGYMLPFGTKTEHNKSTTTPEMDALKMRKGWTAKDVSGMVESGISYFINQLFALDPFITGTRSRNTETKTRVKKIQQLLKRPTKKTILIIPSSSPLPEMIASYLANELTNRGSDVEILPKDFLFTQSPTLSSGYPAAFDYKAKDKIDAEIEALLAQSNKTTKYQELVNIRNQVDILIKKRKDRTFHAKNHMMDSKSNYGKAYYGWIGSKHELSSDASDLIIIDDNIVSGRTVADTIKTLNKQNKRTLSVVGIVLHKFISPGVDNQAATRRPYARAATPTYRNAREALRAGALSQQQINNLTASVSDKRQLRADFDLLPPDEFVAKYNIQQSVHN